MEYKPNKKNVILNVLSIIVLLFIVSIYSDSIENIFYFVFIILIVYILWFFLSQRVTSIRINPQKKEISFTSVKLFFVTERKTYSINQLNFSYKKEVTSRGLKVNTLRLSSKKSNRLIFSITPNFNGWSEGNLNKVYNDLTKYKEK